jgi:beta-N-acetylhexosaminidase
MACTKKRYFAHMKFNTTLRNLFLPALILTACTFKNAEAQLKKKSVTTLPENHWGYAPDKAKAWADSVYQSLNEEERIGQLFMVAAYSGGENYNQEHIEQLLKKHQIGGIIFMQGTAAKQAELTNKYQKMAQVPLLIGMDAEWGLGMRLTGIRNYPRQMMIGATADTILMYKIGAAVATQCKRLGVHVNFAPDIDVNNNPANPVINFRSFGEDKNLVANMGIAYMKGLQHNGILACAKHFPGHGDVATDSHLDLPIITKSLQDLKNIELYPFQKLIEAGVQSAMIAHLAVPAIDSTPHLPSTLSYNTATKLLKQEMGFKGLIFTDALNMKGVTKYFPDGETDLRAFAAGNDVLLFSQDVPLAIQKIKTAIKQGQIPQAALEESVTKILMAKYFAGLHTFTPIDTTTINNDLNAQVEAIKKTVAEEAVTLVKNNDTLFTNLREPTASIGYLSIGNADSLSNILKEVFPNIQNTTTSNLNKFDVVIVSIHASALYPGKDGQYGLTKENIESIQKAAKQPNVIVAMFGNAYALKYACDAPAILMGYEENRYSAKAICNVLEDKTAAPGKLPVKPCD